MCRCYRCGRGCASRRGIAGRIGPSRNPRSTGAGSTGLPAGWWAASSAINAMIYCRGHGASYDRWQHLAGDQADTPAWNYEALLPYFLRGEDFEGD